MPELNSEQIGKLRAYELSILDNFIEVCNVLGLRYFIVQGTLIGAIRHKGFIPWDDDIDVGMFRKDYDVFVENARQYLPENIFLQTHGTDPGYMHSFAKLRNSDTTFIELSCKNIDMNHGIYIDIFPFDYYPDNRLAGIWYDARKLLIRYRVRENYYIPSDSNPSVKNSIRWILKRISKILYPTIEIALKKQEYMYRSVPLSKRLINNGSPWGNKERIPVEWMDNTVTVQFESFSVEAPQDYDSYLRNVYGDYMKMPPEEKRIPHHYLYKLDFKRSYKTYLTDAQESI
ncbi:MAG: LicD family protein [Firmicutes bacterium]|nr:LicD family protein [Bacillota bacterium]